MWDRGCGKTDSTESRVGQGGRSWRRGRPVPAGQALRCSLLGFAGSGARQATRHRRGVAGGSILGGGQRRSSPAAQGRNAWRLPTILRRSLVAARKSQSDKSRHSDCLRRWCHSTAQCRTCRSGNGIGSVRWKTRRRGGDAWAFIGVRENTEVE